LDLAIETFDLTKSYGTLTAVDNLNLKVERKSIHGFLGPNGAGKTTTIKLLMGLVKPSKGTIKILGQEMHWSNASIRSHIGYSPELPQFPKHLKGSELLDVYARIYGMPEQERKEKIPKLIERVGLKGRENDLIGKYSKGMKQRIGIAQALLNSPELIILDEPSTGLDPVGMKDVRALITEIAKEGVTIFLSSHLLFEVEQICNNITIINQGKSLVSDTLPHLTQVSSSAILQIELANLSDAIVKAITEMPTVSVISKNNNILTVKIQASTDIRTEISEKIAKAGGLIISMNMSQQSLEDIFVGLIEKSKQQRNA
jgi:ABC-2 type transport system ATP-binding protein